MTTPTALTKLDRATQMLAEVRTADEAKNIIDLAEAARVYAKQVDLGLEAQNHAAEIKIRAQRKAGEILAKIEKGAGRPNLSQPVTNFKQDTYDDIGITRQDASRWQQIATLPAETFEAFIAETKDEEKELTTSAALRVVQEVKRENVHNKPQPQSPDGKYRVIYADPPWKYNNSGVITESDNYGRAERHYPSMTIEELCAMPIKHMAEDNSVLFLWATSPLLEEAFKVVNAWGFQYKTSFVWDKVGHNYGHYNSVRHELLLVCTRGSCTPDSKELVDSVQTIEKSRKHSEKPEQFRQIIDTLYTYGKRIELFARSVVEGWEVWGNEAIS